MESLAISGNLAWESHIIQQKPMKKVEKNFKGFWNHWSQTVVDPGKKKLKNGSPVDKSKNHWHEHSFV